MAWGVAGGRWPHSSAACELHAVAQDMRFRACQPRPLSPVQSTGQRLRCPLQVQVDRILQRRSVQSTDPEDERNQQELNLRCKTRNQLKAQLADMERINPMTTIALHNEQKTQLHQLQLQHAQQQQQVKQHMQQQHQQLQVCGVQMCVRV